MAKSLSKLTFYFFAVTFVASTAAIVQARVATATVSAPWVPSADAKYFPLCQDSRKNPVKFERTSSRNEGPAFAATTTDGKPIVVFNLPLMAQFTTSEDSQRFIYLHECGHCELGHIYDTSRAERWAPQELAADCYAAKRAKAIGLNLKNILKDVEPLQGTPTGAERARNIERCYSNAQ